MDVGAGGFGKLVGGPSAGIPVPCKESKSGYVDAGVKYGVEYCFIMDTPNIHRAYIYLLKKAW